MASSSGGNCHPVSELLEKNSGDPRLRLELAPRLQQLVLSLGLPDDSTVIHQFCDVMVQWLSSSNYKVAVPFID